MYNLRPIERMMRSSLPTGSIHGMDLFVTGIEVHLDPHIVLYFGHFNALKSVLCLEKSAVGQQITLSRSVMTQKKKIGDRYPDYKARPGYERNLQGWITEYEGVDNDEGIAKYFRDLSIDTHNDYTSESESFYTESKQFHN